MNILVFLISYGLMIGVATFVIPMTRRIEKLFLTPSSNLFLLTCIMLLLGKMFTIPLPFIIIGCIAYIIYSGKNKTRDKKEQNIAKNMSDEERRKREEFLRNL